MVASASSWKDACGAAMRKVHSTPPGAITSSTTSFARVLRLALAGDEPSVCDLQLLTDWLESSSGLRAYLELFDPCTGCYRIILVGRLGD